MYDDLIRRLHEAQAILALTSAGEWKTEASNGQCQIINLAGYTHQVPLQVADHLNTPDADAMVHCHNLLPQLLADVLAALEGKPDPGLDIWLCPNCNVWLSLDEPVCSRCGATSPTTTTTTMADKLCPKCHSLLPVDLDKCPRCGAAL